MKILILIISIFSFASCHTLEESSGVSTSFVHKNEQKPYNQTLEKNLRTTTVYYNYETLYVVSASMLSSQFYEALSNRVRDHYQSMDVLKNFTINSTVFLSIFSPDYELNDVSNNRIWELFLEIDGRKYPVKSVRKVKEKGAWYSFFPYINNWTTDFIITFDIPESEKLPATSNFIFTMVNSQTRTTMRW